jgi:hypothetical protein
MRDIPVYVISLRDPETGRRNMTVRLGPLRPRSSPQGKQNKLRAATGFDLRNMR